MKKTTLTTPTANSSLFAKAYSLVLILFLAAPLATYANNHEKKCNAEETVDFDDYHYELWQGNVTDTNGNVLRGGNGCMQVMTNGEFTAEWSDIGNTLVRKAKRPGQNNHNVNYYINNSFSGNVFYGAYGWWRNNAMNDEGDVVEYYVVENYGTYNCIDSELTVVKNADGSDFQYQSNGHYYKMYVGTKINQPSFYSYSNDTPVTTFTQVKSIRQDRANYSGVQTGDIKMADHFNNWANKGWPIGDILSEVSFKIEGYDNNGSGTSEGSAYMNATITNSGTYNGASSASGTMGFGGSISGLHKMKSNNGGRYATSNNTNWAPVKEYKKQDYWTSQKWDLKYVYGNVYRIQEKYGHRYLIGNHQTGDVMVSDLDTKGDAQMWTIEHISGNQYSIKCNWGGQYLINTNGQWNELTLASGNRTHNSRRWALESTTENGAKAAPTVTPTATPAIAKVTSKELKLYPNPTSSQLNIDISGYDMTSEASAIIYDLSGRMVQEVSNLTSFTTITMEALPSGSYLIMISTGSESLTRRINRI